MEEAFIYTIDGETYYQRTLGARQTVEVLLLFQSEVRKYQKDVVEVPEGESEAADLNVDAFTLMSYVRDFIGPLLAVILIPKKYTPEEFVKQCLRNPAYMAEASDKLEARVEPGVLMEILADFLALAPASTILPQALKFLKSLNNFWVVVSEAMGQISQQPTFEELTKRYVPSSQEESPEQKKLSAV